MPLSLSFRSNLIFSTSVTWMSVALEEWMWRSRFKKDQRNWGHIKSANEPINSRFVGGQDRESSFVDIFIQHLLPLLLYVAQAQAQYKRRLYTSLGDVIKQHSRLFTNTLRWSIIAK